jgi:protein-S-isoprenylcysteine O-methyltransferase Ste14
MFAIIVAGVAGPAWPMDASSLRRGAGILIAIGGGLRHSLTPFPRPLERARLQVGGAYRLVRHPIYGGLILIALGWSLNSSPLALVLTVTLALVLEAKSRLEESMLALRFPEYGAYRHRVRWRFVPGVH